jgi:hypothetical protein
MCEGGGHGKVFAARAVGAITRLHAYNQQRGPRFTLGVRFGGVERWRDEGGRLGEASYCQAQALEEAVT